MHQPEEIMLLALLIAAASFCTFMMQGRRKDTKQSDSRHSPFIMAGIALIKASDACDLPHHVSLRTHLICDSMMIVCVAVMVFILTQYTKAQRAKHKAF